MDVGLFLDFLALCEMKNFTRAAEARHVSQAAFSRRIQSLELWAKATLIERGPGPIRLTEAGQRLRVAAAEITSRVSRARAEVSGSRNPELEHINIGTTNLLANVLLPTLWEGWSRGRALSARIKVGDIYDLVTELASGNIDLLIVYQSPELPLHLDAKRYESKVLMRDRLTPTASRCLLDSGTLVWPGEELAPVPLMMWPTGDYFARLVDRILKAAPLPIIGTRILESSAFSVLQAMTANGFCVSWLPERTIRMAGIDCGYPAPDGWSLPLDVTVFRDRENDSMALQRLWGCFAPPSD